MLTILQLYWTALKESLNETLHELENYAKISGLKVNFLKAHVVWIGSKKYSTESIKTKWKLELFFYKKTDVSPLFVVRNIKMSLNEISN